MLDEFLEVGLQHQEVQGTLELVHAGFEFELGHFGEVLATQKEQEMRQTLLEHLSEVLILVVLMLAILEQHPEGNLHFPEHSISVPLLLLIIIADKYLHFVLVLRCQLLFKLVEHLCALECGAIENVEHVLSMRLQVIHLHDSSQSLHTRLFPSELLDQQGIQTGTEHDLVDMEPEFDIVTIEILLEKQSLNQIWFVVLSVRKDA